MSVAGQLDEQLRSLEDSGRDYDAGRHEEAATGMAVALAAIFHHTGAAPSLLAELGARYVNLLSTSDPIPADVRYGISLVSWSLRLEQSLLVCQPKLGAARAKRFLPAPSWWSGEPIYRADHTKIRRSDLVLSLAPRGGASDSGTDPRRYPWLIDGTGWKVTLRPGNAPEREVVVHGAHHAALRQVSHEALNSPDLQKLAGRGR